MKNRQKLLVVLAVLIGGALVLATQFERIYPSAGRGRRAGLDTEEIRAAFDAEFLTRPDGYRGLINIYAFDFPRQPRQMDPGLMYRAVAEGSVDVISAFATDGRIPAYGLFVLEDDREFFPPYYAAPLVRQDTLAEFPELRDVLNKLAGRLPEETMRGLNFEADEQGRRASEVAREFLVSEGLLDGQGSGGTGDAGRVTIGGKQFTEQEILGEMMAQLIEAHTDIAVRRRLNLGGTMVCFNALRGGDLDLYAEYTGTALVNILNQDVVRDPDEVYDIVQEAFQEQYGLTWLEPFGFNNTYALAMREDHARALGIETVSDLAELVGGVRP